MLQTIFSMLIVVTPSLIASSATADDGKRTWNFDGDTTGVIAQGFSKEIGIWTVETSDSGKAFVQSAKNANPVFNLTFAGGVDAADVDLSVRMKSVAGVIDQGGGLVWRAADAQNYYLVRYNPLEDNYRLYKVAAGKRTLLLNADIPQTPGWHTLRVTMKGNKIETYFDGKKVHELEDGTFPKAGKIGLWSKADAQTHFDDLTLIGN